MAVFGVSGTDVNEAREGALRGILQQTAGGAANADKAIALAQQLYPDTPKADPYEAAFQFFAEMGRQASQPGATALGSAVGSMQVPMDYLNAKKKEAEETERARMTTALSLGPSLKPKPAAAGSYDWVVDEDGNTLRLSNSEIIKRQAAGETLKPYEKSSATTSTFKERKFYKTGLPAAVVKNEKDAALFESGGWSAVPPEGWSESVDANGFETQASEIITGGVVVFAGKDGSVKVVRSSDGATLTGDEAQAAIDEAYAKGAKVQGDRSQQRALGSLSSEIVSQSYKEMMTVQKNISTLEDAKRALESGAQTGYFAQFIPDVSASAVELQNVKNRLGLDVVSSVTFGALSESELNMALDTGLPESMDEDYLKGWVQERIDAKKKLLDNLSEAASFLARGNSIGDWLVELDKRATTSQDEITPLATEISTMSIEELDAIDIATAGLSNAELQAYIKRANELGAN